MRLNQTRTYLGTRNLEFQCFNISATIIIYKKKRGKILLILPKIKRSTTKSQLRFLGSPMAAKMFLHEWYCSLRITELRPVRGITLPLTEALISTTHNTPAGGI